MIDPSILSQARRIAVKVGSSLLARDEAARGGWMRSLASDLSALRESGKSAVLISSGAVALGRERLGPNSSAGLSAKQAAAAVGQPLLMAAWARAFETCTTVPAQILLTIGDTEARRRWLNARSTLETLLRLGALPIVNENDSVATEELRYGDNDRLSARVAQLVGADLLILLSDVDGFYDSDPRSNPAAAHIARIDTIGAAELSAAGGAAGDGVGTGGMRTKLEAAKLAQSFGCGTLIASGVELNPISGLSAGSLRATHVPPDGTPRSAYKQWIAASLSPTGSITIDEGALVALRRGASLLPSGATKVEGSFVPGDCVTVLAQDGPEVGRGLIRYDAREAATVAGKRGDAIAATLGYSRGDELIHRDDLVLK